eukprot:6198588-Pleurochrysis_carterae.AAC.3
MGCAPHLSCKCSGFNVERQLLFYTTHVVDGCGDAFLGEVAEASVDTIFDEFLMIYESFYVFTAYMMKSEASVVM